MMVVQLSSTFVFRKRFGKLFKILEKENSVIPGGVLKYHDNIIEMPSKK